MDLISILICLAVERWTALGQQIRHYRILEQYVSLAWPYAKKISAPASIQLALLILPLMFFVGIFYFILLHVLYGSVGLLFAVLVLFYCLGAFAIPGQVGQINQILVQANRNIFAVLFWFALLGPMGAILYRLTGIIMSEGITELAVTAERFQTMLDWIPVRLEAVSYGLVSHFGQVMQCLSKYFFKGLDHNEALLVECSDAALGVGVMDVEGESLRLIDRALILWLVVIAIVVIIV